MKCQNNLCIKIHNNFVFLRSASNLRLAKWEAIQDDAKVYFVVYDKLTTTADNNLGEVRMAELPDRILITVAKCRVRTHYNALRFTQHGKLPNSGARSGSPQ